MDRPASRAGANADLSRPRDHLDIAAEAVFALDGNRKMENTAMSNLLPPPERCQTMAEVSPAIATLEHDIIPMLSERRLSIQTEARAKTHATRGRKEATRT